MTMRLNFNIFFSKVQSVSHLSSAGGGHDGAPHVQSSSLMGILYRASQSLQLGMCSIKASDCKLWLWLSSVSCRFLDKVYMLSSAEALAQFMYNPSPYLLEPNPQVPCKLCVLGNLTSGKRYTG